MTQKRIAIGLIITLVLVSIVMALSWFRFLYSPIITSEAGYKYTVRPGESIKTVINDLYFKNIVHNRSFLYFLVRWRGDGHELKAGEYFFAKGTTPTKMLNQLVTGKGLFYHAFTIIPGWNFKDLREAILKEPNLRHTIQNMNDSEIMILLGNSTPVPEGQFLPDTYYFAGGVSDVVVLKHAFKAMQSKLNTAWEERTVNLPYKNTNEVLIAASLIEKEAYLNDERPIIAGVLVNRLQKDMLLQVDPTVIYGMGSRYEGKIHREDLLENTPYNTYVHKGLPPAPIAMPSSESIMAVVHPAKNDYLYYVARGDGSHQFSITYTDHQTLVNEANKLNEGFFNTELLRYHLKKFW